MKYKLAMLFLGIGVCTLSTTAFGAPEGEATVLEETHTDTGYIFTTGDEEITSIEGMPFKRSAWDISYDLREQGKVSSVKNQKDSGLCWTFSCLGSGESGLLTEQAFDLSETHLGYSAYHGDEESFLPHEEWYTAGGNRYLAIATLARGYGAVEEKTVPFSSNPGNIVKEASVTVLKNAYFYPEFSVSEERGISVVKQALVENGAVEIGISATSYDKETNSFYHAAQKVPNHAVLVVGWDDEKVTKAESPGAWLIKNSWGEDWGEQGYAYVSYYDQSLDNPTFYEFGDKDFDNCYQYDSLGYKGYLRFKEAVAGVNVFTTDSQEKMEKVGFYCPSDCNYTISIIGNITSSLEDGEIVGTQSGVTTYAGFYQIPLENPITLTSGERFGVKVELKKGEFYYLFTEGESTQYKKLTAHEKESYLYANGSYEDLIRDDDQSTGNLCIKAYTSEEFRPVTGLTLNMAQLSLTYEPVTLYAEVEPSDTPEKNIRWSTSNDMVAKVEDGVVIPVHPGECVITASADANPEIQAQCKVTVSHPLERLILSKTAIALEKGDTETLNVTYQPVDADGDLTIVWNSSNPKVVNVSDGKITAVGEGNAVIQASCGEIKSECTVTVNSAAGWVSSTPKWKYRRANGTFSTDCWEYIDGKWYYFDKQGYMQTGWMKKGNTWYYLRSSGAMATGWLREGNTWYYLRGSGAMATGWLREGDTWYYLRSSGAMATGWLKLGDTWYYLNGSGAMQTGWIRVGNAWYYLSNSGAMAANRWIGNYYVGSSGAMLTNTRIGVYYVGSNGAWIPGR